MRNSMALFFLCKNSNGKLYVASRFYTIDVNKSIILHYYAKKVMGKYAIFNYFLISTILIIEPSKVLYTLRQSFRSVTTD